MYHPDSMLKIAHNREAELVREAQICGVPQAEARPGTIRLELGLIVIAGTIFAMAVSLIVG
jgi:hypothetical protein